VRWVEVWAAAEVASLQVNERLVPVHDHGVAVVVWGTERLPHIAALGANGSPVGPIQFHDSPATGCSGTVRSVNDARVRARATARTV
jgi:hypothetical protein